MDNSKQPIHIRDLRKDYWYRVDNVFIDEYGNKVGPYGILVYNVLCRHSNTKTQICWPSIETISDKCKISISSVKRGIKFLLKYNIIKVVRTGKKLNNNYILLDRVDWMK